MGRPVSWSSRASESERAAARGRSMRAWCAPLPADSITNPCVEISPPICANGGFSVSAGLTPSGPGLGTGLGVRGERAVGLRCEGVAARVKAAWIAVRSKLIHFHASEHTSTAAKDDATCNYQNIMRNIICTVIVYDTEYQMRLSRVCFRPELTYLVNNTTG